MQDKSNPKNLHSQTLPAGVDPNDHNIEFVGNRENFTTIWLRCGNAHPWNTLPEETYKSCEELFFTDHEAIEEITENFPEESYDVNRLVEIYICLLYGDLDNAPDVVNGKLMPCENFRSKRDCISLKFRHKHISINGVPLSNRDIKIIDMTIDGLTDKVIAFELGISQSTFDFHKRNLFNHIHANSKTDVVVKAFQNQVAC